MSWEIDTLGNYSKVISGYAFKSDSFRTDNGIPIIKIKNIQREYVEIDGEYFVDTSYLSLDPKFHCIKNDILISLTGSHITLPNSVVGRVAKYHYDFTSLLNQRGGKIVVTNPDKLENNYLYYYLCQNEIRIKLAQFGRGGANQCNISPSNVESIPIILPPLETQKRIASILSNYDDLIENNLKRIKLLEETAQNIYKEWFVNFRFPNYEHTEFEEESGLPVGWEKVIFSDLYSLNNGCAFKSEDYKNEGTPILRTRDYSTSFFIQMNDPIYLSTDLINNHSKYLVEELDFLIIMVGASIGKYGVVLKKDLPSLLNQNQWAIRTLSEFSVYNLFKIFSLQDVMRELLMKRTGAARDFFRASFLKELKVIKPNLSNILEFNDKVEPIMNMISLLLSQNQKLKEARDILLPRLMNRTIEV